MSVCARASAFTLVLVRVSDFHQRGFIKEFPVDGGQTGFSCR